MSLRLSFLRGVMCKERVNLSQDAKSKEHLHSQKSEQVQGKHPSKKR